VVGDWVFNPIQLQYASYRNWRPSDIAGNPCGYMIYSLFAAEVG
jgi:hypothetical protein